MIRRGQRGRLKIYLGYVAGVGKTYEMLQEAHRLQNEGIDVAAGFVETHGRIETARLVEGLEVIARKKHDYHGVTLEEMDLDAVLARKPEIVLVDELAHTNVTGSRNAKRYEDVQEILDAGIHVISTLNIQHLESLYNVVEQATGVKVRERIPDSVVFEADQLVNVDLPHEDLQERLSEGKIYPKERTETALQNFFKKTNLDQLRELTLREMAAHIDSRYRDSLRGEIAATPDQIMVCLSSQGPNSEKLLRYASRLAGRLNRNWYAVYIQTPSEDPAAINARTQRLLSDTLTLAKQLGAIVFVFKGEDVAKAILHFAREYRVGHVIVGSPGRIPFLKRLAGKRSVVDNLIHDSKGITITMLDTAERDLAYPSDLDRMLAQKPVEHPPLADSGRYLLSRFIIPEAIVIWKKPVSKDEAIEQLVKSIRPSTMILYAQTILDAILEREKQGSTFLNEGVAFPHARIKELRNSFVAIGIARKGISDVLSDQPVECVFMIISPSSDPDEMLHLLAHTSKAYRDRQVRKALRSAKSPENVLEVIRNWESADEIETSDQHGAFIF